MTARLTKAEVDTRPRGWEKTSDHAPVWIEIGEPKKTRRRPVIAKS
ncbi:hypothetical protein [Brevundimonas sp.]|nr:hypothetical protein [Brevundimonas sp.]